MKYYLGIDVGATTAKLGILDQEQTIIGERYDISSKTSTGPQEALDEIYTAFVKLLEKYNISMQDIKGIGACFPTPVSADGNVLHPTNIDPSWKGVNVKQMLEEKFGMSTFLLNDGEAAAYREYSVRQKLNRATNSMAQFITGTGLGGAVIMYGKVLTGDGLCIAGELGHVLTDTSNNADRCGCGAFGCAETRSSLMGLANLVRITQEQNEVPVELQGKPMDVAKKVRKLIQSKNPHPLVKNIWVQYFTHIGRAARVAANVLGSSLIVLSGGAQEKEDTADNTAYEKYLLEGRDIVEKEVRASFPHLENVKVEWSIDTIPDSAAYGAAAYAGVLL